MTQEPDGREKVVGWVRGLIKQYPAFGREDDDTGAPEPNVKAIERAIENLKDSDDTLKSLNDADALAKIVSAPRTYNSRLNAAVHGKSFCQLLREEQNKRGLY